MFVSRERCILLNPCRMDRANQARFAPPTSVACWLCNVVHRCGQNRSEPGKVDRLLECIPPDDKIENSDSKHREA
jgi:hypothetical protein